MVYFPKSFAEDLTAALNSKNQEQLVACIRSNSVNRVALEIWIVDTYDALVWIENNLDLSLKVLHVISEEFTPQEYLKVEGIFKIFQTRLNLNLEKKKAVSDLKSACSQTLYDKLLNLHEKEPQKFKEYFLSKDTRQWSPLHYAAKEGNLEFFSFVLSKDPALFAFLMKIGTIEDYSPLMVAWIHQKMDVIKFISQMQKSCFENFLGERFGVFKMTPLIYAAFGGHTAQFEYVSRNHAEIFVRNIQETDCEKMTCLHWAALKGNNDIVQAIRQIDTGVLLKLLEKRDSHSLTPLHYAVKGSNYDLIRLIENVYPKKHMEFMKVREPELFAKMCEAENENAMPLLHSLAAKGKVELLKLIAEKEPDTFLIYMQKVDKRGLTPLQHAAVNKQRNIFKYLAKGVPDILQKLIDIKFINWLLPDHLEFAEKIRRFCTDPLIKAIFNITLTIFEEDDSKSTKEIRAELAKFPPQEFIRAILDCNAIRSYLGRRDDILSPALEALPSLNFLSLQNCIDLLLHLPPSKIFETIQQVKEDKYRDHLNSLIFVDGEDYSVKEILRYAHHQFAPHMDQENAFNSVHDYLMKIKPKTLACSTRHQEMREIILHFLKAIPDPHYRAIIPLLSLKEFMTFMKSLHVVQQLSYCLAATCKQKEAYVESLQELIPAEIVAWKDKIREMCGELEEKLKKENRDAKLLKKLFQEIKELWSNGYDKLIPVSQNALVFNQMRDRLLLHESSADLLFAVTEKIELALLDFRRLQKGIETLRVKIWRDFEGLQELKERRAPEEFFCPITGDIMSEPMKDKYGHRYEKTAIISWLESHQSSPLTRQPLSLADLTADSELQQRIEEFNKG